MFHNPNTKLNQYQFITFGAMSTKIQTGCEHTEVCSCGERMTNLIQTVNLITDAIVFA